MSKFSRIDVLSDLLQTSISCFSTKTSCHWRYGTSYPQSLASFPPKHHFETNGH